MTTVDKNNMGKLTNLVRSPCCRAELVDSSKRALSCSRCLREFPAWRGILDLRTVDTLQFYYPHPEEWLNCCRKMETAIEERFEQMDYRNLIRHSLDCWGKGLTGDVKKAYIRARYEDIERGAHTASLLKPKAAAIFDEGKKGLIGIDIGCGSGSTLYALSKICRTVIGIDYFRCDLIVARKLIEEEGLSNVHLIAGVFEASIIRPCSFDVVTARDVLEHVTSPLLFLQQCFQLLQSPGLLYFNSANRYAIIPEPHVLLWGVGFLPRFMQRHYVKLLRKHPYENINLLSLREVISLTKSLPHSRGIVEGPCMSNVYARKLTNELHFPGLKDFISTYFADQHEVYLFKEK